MELGLDFQTPRQQQLDYTQTYNPLPVFLTLLTASLRPVTPTPTMPNEYLPKSPAETKEEAMERLKNDRAKTDQQWEDWNKALEASAIGWRKPKSYFPVVICPDTPISTPEKLQEMAGMTTPPRVFNTTYTTMHGGLDDAHLRADGKPEEVQVGQVTWRELVEIKNKAECDDWLFVFVDGKIRGATMVKSFETGDKNAAKQQLGGGTHEIQPDTGLHEIPTE